MKNKELYSLYQGLNKCGNLSGVKFAYAIAKNKKTLFQEFQTIEELDAHKNQVKFDKEGTELRKKCMEKDKEGNEKLNSEKYDKEVKELIEKNKNVQKEFENLMNVENDVKLLKVKLDDIPKDITVDQMTLITDIIDK